MNNQKDLFKTTIKNLQQRVHTSPSLFLRFHSNGYFIVLTRRMDVLHTESVGIKSCERYDDSTDTFNENVRFNGERYEAALPWKDDMPQLPSDFDLCSKRGPCSESC